MDTLVLLGQLLAICLLPKEAQDVGHAPAIGSTHRHHVAHSLLAAHGGLVARRRQQHGLQSQRWREAAEGTLGRSCISVYVYVHMYMLSLIHI